VAAETGFMIDGSLYEMPSLDSFTMDEAQVLYDYSGLTIEDFAAPEDAKPNAQGDYDLDEDQQQKMRNPGFMRALLHVAYQRGNPRMSHAKVKTLVGGVNVLALFEQLAGQQEGDAEDPPALTTEPAPSSQSDSVVWSESSGDGSARSSDRPAVQPRRITTIGSDTSSTLGRTVSAE
jgi:hypothetical protein